MDFLRLTINQDLKGDTEDEEISDLDDNDISINPNWILPLPDIVKRDGYSWREHELTGLSREIPDAKRKRRRGAWSVPDKYIGKPTWKVKSVSIDVEIKENAVVKDLWAKSNETRSWVQRVEAVEKRYQEAWKVAGKNDKPDPNHHRWMIPDSEMTV